MTFTKTSLIASSMLIAAIAVIGIPTISFAATYAYVDQTGTVKTVVADSSMMALATAPNISALSGVMLLDMATTNNGVVGDSVSGT